MKAIRKSMADKAARLAAALLPRRLMCAKRHFSIWEKHGYHITPVHFYEPLPNVGELPESIWQEPDQLIGMQMNDDQQLALLDLFSARYKNEYCAFPVEKSLENPEAYHINNGWFSFVDAEMLYCLMRHAKPKTVIEIGSGYSTMMASLAIGANTQENPDYRCKLVSIEPFPRHALLEQCTYLSERIELPVQKAPSSVFDQLGANDILFIDSSHVSKLGSDVNYEFFNVIPNLKDGVFVHVHDIFLPLEYPKTWATDLRLFWNEQYLLRAFMTFNSRFEVVWAASYMNYQYPERLRAAFPSLPSDSRPASFWIQKTGALVGHDAPIGSLETMLQTELGDCLRS